VRCSWILAIDDFPVDIHLMPIFSTVPCSQLCLVSLNPEPLGLTSPPSSTAGEAVIWEWRSGRGGEGGVRSVSPPLKQRHSQDRLLFSVPSLISIFRDTPVGVLQQRIHLLLLILLTSLLSLNFSLLNSSKSVTTSFYLHLREGIGGCRINFIKTLKQDLMSWCTFHLPGGQCALDPRE